VKSRFLTHLSTTSLTLILLSLAINFSLSGYVKLHNIRKNYAVVELPGIGYVKFHNSRDFRKYPFYKLKSSVVKREGSNWYISLLIDIPDVFLSLPDVNTIDECKSIVGIDVGINKLVALSDGSFAENKRITTNKKTARRMAMRQRAISRKKKGSKNRIKAINKLAKQKHKLAQCRNGYGWQIANVVVKTADAVAREDLRIKNMVKRAKPKHDGKGGFKRNNASQKTGLNRVILDAGWGDIFNKIAWLALKAGKPVILVPAKHTSQECIKCGHIDQKNREGEKFICIVCNHTDHADTKASRTIARRVGLVFLKNEKTLRADCAKVTPSRHQPIVVETRNHAFENGHPQMNLL